MEKVSRANWRTGRRHALKHEVKFEELESVAFSVNTGRSLGVFHDGISYDAWKGSSGGVTVIILCRWTRERDEDGRKIYETWSGDRFKFIYTPATPRDADSGRIVKA